MGAISLFITPISLNGVEDCSELFVMECFE